MRERADLSTSLFRAYRFVGGDSADLAVKQFTSRYMTYLIIYGVGALTPGTNSSDPAGYVDELMDADIVTTPFEGIPGGWAHRVVRWAFEKRDLYNGDPPATDVYVDDSRAGGYEPFLTNFWNTTEIWNRLAADGVKAHQTRVTGQTNYAYVTVRNRGLQSAINVVVRGYHCKHSAGLVWPIDWDPMTTASVLVAGSVASGGGVDVGPFEWTPDTVGHECMLMMVDAGDDAANDSTADDPIAHWRLVPFDNSVAQRNVAPVAGGGSGLTASFDKRFLWLRAVRGTEAIPGRVGPSGLPAATRLGTHGPSSVRAGRWR